jgi:hypothetical protein
MTGMKLAALAVATMLASAAGCGESSGEPTGPTGADDVTGVTLNLTTVPVDAKCYRATFTAADSSQIVRTVSPTAGSTATIAFTGMPTGTFSLQLEVFDLACASVVPTTPLAWVGWAYNFTLNTGQLTPLTILLKRPAGTAVTVDYDSAVTLSPSTGGLSAYDIVVSEPYLYVARGSQLERVPITGGGLEIVATGQGIGDVAADATGTYFSDTVSPGTYWVAPGQAKRQLVPRGAHSLALTPTGLLGVYLMNGAGTGTIERYTSSGTVTTLVTGLYSPTRIVSDGTSIVWFGSNGASGYVVQRTPMAGGTPTTLYTTNANAYINDVAVDATNVYFALPGAPGMNGIYRVPVAGGTAVSVAPVAVGQPTRVVTDATNVYYLVRIYDGQGSCVGAQINKAPKAGGAITTLWSRMGVCATQLTQSTSYLFFDSSLEVRRIDK